jgi:serine/threonine protein kinase
MCRVTKELPAQLTISPAVALDAVEHSLRSLSLAHPSNVPSTPEFRKQDLAGNNLVINSTPHSSGKTTSCSSVCSSLDEVEVENESSSCSPVSDVATVHQNKKQDDINYYYKLGHLIREGIYGEIRFASRKDEQKEQEQEQEQYVAIKVFNLEKLQKSRSRSSLSSYQSENPLKEIEIQKQFSFENEKNLVPILDMIQSMNHLYVVLPFYRNGDLLDVIENSEYGRLPLQQVKEMFSQVCLGVRTLQQSYQIAHRDLSVENIFYDSLSNTYAIGDFGLSYQVSAVSDSSSGCVSAKNLNICGKEGYIAPELWMVGDHQGEEKEGETKMIDLFACDIWSLGIILFMSLTGSAPMKRAMNDDPYYDLICNENRLLDLFEGNIDSLLTIEEGDDEAEEKEREDIMKGLQLVQTILTPDPMMRPTIDELLSHEWLLSCSEKA